MIFRLIRWFFPRRKWQAPPSVVIVPYDITRANENERLIMRFGLARSPEEATRLMKKYGVSSAGELLGKIPPRKKRTFKQRFTDLIRRMDGHDTRKLFQAPYEPIRVDYCYEKDYHHETEKS